PLSAASGRGKIHHRHRPLLRASRERPRRRTADKRDELAPFHSITSSAMASSVGGTVRPSIRAVLRLITSSNLVGRSTGRGLFAFENSPDIDASWARRARKARAVTHQTACNRGLTHLIACGQMVTFRQLNEPLALRAEQNVAIDQKRTSNRR